VDADYKSQTWELIQKIKKEIDIAISPILHEVGLSEHQAAVIMATKSECSQTISKLAEYFNANQGNFSVTCKKMEQAGLILRKRSREDERVVELKLTEFGEKKLNELKQSLDVLFKKAQVTPEQFETIIAGYNETITVLKKINKGEKTC
jgi:DNA-binding MarR family transcriptional regulator